MSEEYKDISIGLYGGDSQLFNSKKERFELEIIQCNNCKNCPLYKVGQCVMADRLGRLNLFSKTNTNCPYAKINRKVGTNPRTKNYYDLKNEYYSDKYKELKNHKAQSPLSVMYFEVGDYAYIRLTKCKYQIVGTVDENNNVLSIRVLHGGAFWGDLKKDDETYLLDGKGFIAKKLLTKEIILELLDGIPNLQDKNLMIHDLLSYRTDLSDLPAPDFIGLEARLNTLTPPFKFKINDVTFEYTADRKVLAWENEIINRDYINSFYSTYLGKPEKVNVILIPDDKVYIKIQDNSWVNSNTVFK